MRAMAQPVEIKTADEADLHACLALDDSYISSHTLQVEVVRGEPGSLPFNMNVSNVTMGDSPVSIIFRPVKLPRPRKIQGQIATLMRDGTEAAQLSRVQAWKAADLVLVAYQGKRVCGYIVITIVPGSGIGWISALVVDGSMRRQGIGTMLMAAARRWARYDQGQNVRSFMLEVPTKNYPGVMFCRKEGFNFCGYTDYSFSNGDTVLLFASAVVI